MSVSSVSFAVMSTGAVATVAGALLYVLPGPGFPVLALGLTLMVAGAAVRISGRRRRS
ncbi:hypothetical protein ACFYQA_17140 [Streptomyces sp. NPDC005774]|uniref:hypothetical protein n=1 Tax=Streptomyces sp. NPDC005774 TaxID=3364728 RepID=UPI00368D7828